MRLIDADALDLRLEVLMIRYMSLGRQGVAEDYNFVRTVISSAETIDAVEVVRGRWKKANNRPKSYIRVCSVCGKEAYFCGEGCSYKYCPNCGTKMDGKINEDM